MRPPLLVVTGSAGVGKSTICARLAGTIPGTILLDADVFGEDIVSLVPPNQDFQAFWRSMMRLAHELAQNNLVVVYFSTMLPEQLLANVDVLDYFDAVHFLCLTCPAEILQERLTVREGHDDTKGTRVSPATKIWSDFNVALTLAATEIPTSSAIDGGRTADEVESDVRGWINNRMGRSEH